MSIKVLVPRLGEGVEEVTLTKWLKHEGDPVNELEPLLEVNTDKVDTEIPSPASGVLLRIEVDEGWTAKVGEVLALIGESGEAPEAPVSESRPQPQAAPHELGFISPVVARIAAERGVDLQQVKGSGLGGRITKNDVLAFVEASRQVESKQIEVEQRESKPLPAVGDRIIKHTPIRKQIAAHMLESKRTSPHVLTVMEADMGRVRAHQAAHKDAFAQDGVSLTYTAYFIAAVVAGLKAYPVVNTSWSEEGVILHSAIHIGMATSLGEEGLIVPVIKNADGLSLLGLARAVNDLAGRARAKKLQPDEVKGGTFTLTNHGISGSLLSMPVINQPQCGILGSGVIQKRAVVVTDGNGNDAIAVRPMVYLSFVFDHRILDGASADWFLAKVKETLEQWT